MGYGSEVEDDEGYLGEQKGEDEEKKEDNSYEDSELEEEKDFEDDQIKSGEFGDDNQELTEESIWGEIDWSEDIHGEREETIWDDIDWSEDKRGEREETIWDDIDWSEDMHGEREKNEKNKNDDQKEKYNEEDYVENIESQSTSTVLTNEIEEIEGNLEHHEQEEEIEIRPEKYQEDMEPIDDNTDESEFIKNVEELAEYVRETKKEDENIEPQAEQENAGYYAEQYYEKLKEKEVLNDQNSKEEQAAEELRQEVTEELKGDQERGYKSDELEEEDIIKASEEITSTEEFEYLWEVRDKLDQEEKTSEEIEEVMHEAEEMYETFKNAEKLYEEQEQEKLKLVNHEDEASVEDLKEDLDRVDLIEQAVELEEKLIQQGKLQEEIDTRVEEAIEETIETAEFEEKLEKIIEKERKELKVHEDEESVEKEDLDRVELIEQAVELEEKLVQRGESQEEIDTRVEEAIEETIETTEFEEKLEKIIEKERKELKVHEDEEDIDNTREDIDRPAEAEYYMEIEEELHRQGISQEEIDEQMEEIASNYQNEINKKQEKEEEPNVSEKLEKHDLEIDEQNSRAEQRYQIELTSVLSNEKEVENYENVENKENLEALKPELDAIESESEDKKDFLEESTKLGSEESDEEENENLQELYRQETDRRPVYAKKKTKGYSQWLEQRELSSEKIKNSKSESEKKKEIEEEGWKTTLKQWIKEASEEECNAELKSELKKALESYNEFEDLTRKFLKLYEKSQYEKLSEKEKNILKSLTERLQGLGPIQLELLANIRAFKDYFYNHLWELMNRFFVIRVRSKFFKHISQKYKELRKEQKNEKIKYLNNCLVNQGNLGENSLNPLTSKQIKKYEQKYLRKLEGLCVKYALDFKNIIIEEYGYKLLNLKKQIPLSSHFSFRLDKYIRKVSHLKRDRAIGVGILERVRLHIVQKYSTITKDAAKETSFRKVIDFIKEYKEFSLHVSGKSGQGMFSISNIKYEQNSEKLAPKSWLIENLRYIFPKKAGLPIQDNLLSWFIFGDSPSYGRVSKLRWTTEKREISKRMHLSELLAIDYSVNKLTTKAFSDKGIKISNKNLETLKKSVSFLIYYYVFGGYHESTYVSKTTAKELEVGKNFFTIEYEIIRAIFFVAAEANGGVSVNIETISRVAGVSDLKHHLFEGYGFGDDFNRLLDYFNRIFKNRPPDSSSQIFRDAKEVLVGYRDAYRAKNRAFQKTREHKTKFQGRVHKELEAFLGLKFTKEEQVRAVVKEKYVTTINDEGISEKIYVHGAFKFDGYLDLSKALKDYLGLDDKWMGIAFEAMGMYWHTLPRQKEADRKKRLICKEKNIILLEIKESWDASRWGIEALKQFKKITGVEIPPNKLKNLYKYLGNI